MCIRDSTYSILQPALAGQLRDRKLGHLAALEPEIIISANIGCIGHLQGGTALPVRHWVEVLDDAMAEDPGAAGAGAARGTGGLDLVRH